jgi:hypothetical protein
MSVTALQMAVEDIKVDKECKTKSPLHRGGLKDKVSNVKQQSMEQPRV